MTGNEIRTAIRDRIGTMLSKYPCPANVQILQLFDEVFDVEDEQSYVEAYEVADKGIEHPLDFLAGVSAERIFAAIEEYYTVEE